MLRLDGLPCPPGYAAGRTYTLAASPHGDVMREARAVWNFLARAERLRGHLVLHPPGQGDGAAPLESFPAVPFDAGRPADPETGARVTLFTSGTTGAPKPVTHDIDTVLATLRARAPRAGDEELWLLCYRPWRWAGLSVLMHAFAAGAGVAVPASLGVNDIVDALLAGQVTAISLTPSLLRRVMTSGRSDALAGGALRQITLGGEAATQDLLDRARSIWPRARITQVYASTEHTDILAVSDGLAGFPETKLRRPDLFLDPDGQLWIRGRPTGDFWRRAGARFLFRGRAGEIINVGGALVSLVEIEDQVRAIDGIRDARAYALPNPILHTAAALQYVGAPDERSLRRVLAARLPRAAMPVKIDRVAEIPLGEAQKIRRLR